MSDDKTRDAIARTARLLHEQAQRTGAKTTEAQAREIVERARETGDRKRDSNR